MVYILEREKPDMSAAIHVYVSVQQTITSAPPRKDLKYENVTVSYQYGFLGVDSQFTHVISIHI